MKKKPRKEGARRHCYFYFCACGRKRATFDHDRAKRKECVSCENARIVAQNQPSLL